MGTEFTYDAVGNREGLLDVLTYISPTNTPLWSSLAKKAVSATYTEWLTQALPSATSNAAVEGAAWSAGTVTARVRTGNYSQILKKCYTISRTQNNVDKAAVADEIAEQRKLALLNLARDIEYALINGTGNSGASGTAREMKGIRSFISTTNTTGTGTGSEDLTESMFNDCLQAIKAQNGDPTDVYVNAFQKRQISQFKGREGNVTVMDNASAKAAYNVVDMYYGDFGSLSIHYHNLATTSEVLILQQDMFQVGIFDSPQIKEVLPGAIDGASFGIVTELTLLSKNEAFSGKITQLSTS